MLDIRSLSLKLDGFELDNISFQVEKGDYYIVLGESGSGKTLLLETIAGLYRPAKGKILINHTESSLIPINQRPTRIVFQDHLIFPHLNVFDNIAYPLHRQKISKAEIRVRVNQISSTLKISQLLKKKKSQLSGGEIQRVALARTLVLKPDILLLDEPLASVDVGLKSEIRQFLRQINRDGQTIIHVTHDYEEAISLGNKVAILEKGKMLQSGDIHDVFLHPKSSFVAKLSGTSNFFHVRVQQTTDNKTIATTNEGFSIFISSTDVASEGFALIKAEEIVVSLQQPESSALNVHYGIISEVADSANGIELWIDIGVKIVALITLESFKKMQLGIGKNCWISWKSSAVKLIES